MYYLYCCSVMLNLSLSLHFLSLSLFCLPLAEAAAREAALNTNPVHGEYAPPPPSVIAPSRQSGAEARIQMMQQEEEEGEIHVDTAHAILSSRGVVCRGEVPKLRYM